MDEIGTVADRIWAEDILGRRDDALYLQNYLSKRFSSKPAERGFVLAVNAEWGFGKTFLMSRWMQQSRHEGHPAVFFDAWKNDFTEDPLLAFIAEFDSGLTEYFKKVPIAVSEKRKVMRAAKNLWKPAVTILACAGAKHIAGLSLSSLREVLRVSEEDDEDKPEDTGKNFKEVADKLKDAVKDSLKQHTTVKNSIEDFKGKLSILVETLEDVSGVQLPIIVFIDELDRCRPDYAIELLEGIKHLFGVPGVYFVISTNIQQLGESVKAIYGSGFDGQRYLKRFFDLQYSLREPSKKQFAEALVEKMSRPKLESLIYGLEGVVLGGGDLVVQPEPRSILSFIFEKHVEIFEFGLRDQMQMATILEASLITLADKKIHIFLLMFLSAVYQADPVVFGKIARAKNLTEGTGFSELHPGNGRGQISFASSDERGDFVVKKISVLKIADSYFRMMDITIAAMREKRRNSFDFPANLLRDPAGKSVGDNFVPDFIEYFSVIQHAGGFSLNA